jgi:hypothetical protein
MENHKLWTQAYILLVHYDKAVKNKLTGFKFKFEMTSTITEYATLKKMSSNIYWYI